MTLLNQTILNIMIDKAITLLSQSSLNDGRLVELLRKVPVEINYRMRTCGGRCQYKRNRYTGMAYEISVDINYDYASRATEEQVYNTVAHELAHAYHILLTQSTDHGGHWQRIHIAMGGTAERCHKVEVQKNTVHRHQVKDMTDGKTYTVSTRRLNQLRAYRLQDGTSRFICQSSYVKPQRTMTATA